MNSGKSPATRKRLVFISSTARAQRLPAFDCSRVSARDADCGSTSCAATDIWFFSFCGLVAGMADPAVRDRLSRNPAGVDRRGSAAELLLGWVLCELTGLRVKGFVGKTRIDVTNATASADAGSGRRKRELPRRSLR